MSKSKAVASISSSVDACLWGVRNHIDAFVYAVGQQGGRAYPVCQIADADDVPSDHVLAWGEGPDWVCRLVQVGSRAKVVEVP